MRTNSNKPYDGVAGKGRFLTLLFLLIGVLFFYSVITAEAKKADNETTRENADKKAKIGYLREWKEKNTAVVPGVLIVKFKPQVQVTEGTPGTNRPLLNHQLNRAGVRSLKRLMPVTGRLREAGEVYGLDRIYYAELQSGVNEFEAAEILTRDISVEYAEPKRIHYLSYIPNDPLYMGGSPGPQNGYFERMKVPQAWDILRADSNASGIIPKNQRVIIAVVDGGTMWEHQDLRNNIYLNSAEDRNGNGVWDTAAYPAGDRDGIDQDADGYVDNGIGWNFAINFWNPRGPASTPNSADHGTACASYFGAVTQNAVGMAGTAFNPQIMPICAGHPSYDDAIYYGYEGILYAAAHGAHIISCSWGGVGGYSNFEQEVIQVVTDAGSLVLAAAGNGGSDGIGDNNDLIPNYPANYKRVLAVGSVGKTTDTKSTFSNYGTTVPVYAVGENVVSCVDQTGGATYQSSGWSGTSMSTPMVAGLAGLIKTKYPSWTPDQIRMQIRSTADSIDGVNSSYAGKLGRGRINFYRALTESRPGLDMVNASAVTPSGENIIFLAGDTIYLNAVFKNVLLVDASNVTFTIESSGSQVTVIQQPSGSLNIPAGSQKSMPKGILRVSPTLTGIATVFLKITVSADGNYKDAFGVTVNVYPSLPNWSLQTSPVGSLTSIHAANGDVAWAVGNGGAIIRTTNGGNSWELIPSGIIGTEDLYNVFALDANIAFTTSTPSTTTFIYRTTNGGQSWQQVYSQSGGFINAIHMFDQTNGIAQGDPVGGKWTILRTTNGGASWYRIATEPTPATGEAGWNNSMCWIGSNNGWFGTNKTKIWRTTDGGATWSSAATTGITNTTSVSFSDASNGLAGNGDNTSKTTYMRTTNGGQSWFSASLPAATTNHTVVYTPNSPYAWCATASGRMYRAVNFNTPLTWQTQLIPPVTGVVADFSIVDTTRGWAVTSAGEIMEVGTYVAAPVFTSLPDTLIEVGQTYIYDAGASGIPVPVYRLIQGPAGMTIDTTKGILNWTPTVAGDYPVTLMAVNSLGSAVQSFTLHVVPSTGIHEPNNGIPSDYRLFENYPNPFNPLTLIRYALPENARVKLTIYNLLGQEICTLVNSRQSAGYHQIYWNGKDQHGRSVASGIYLYRLEAGHYVATKKMLLIK